jgi:glycyl-tRNA synthetase beta subunit
MHKVSASEAVEKRVLDFLLERAKFILRGSEDCHDEINAAFAAGADDLVDVAEVVGALKAIRIPRILRRWRPRSSASKHSG